jgi:glycosyltransferase involved in cell wall biosynthesis
VAIEIVPWKETDGAALLARVADVHSLVIQRCLIPTKWLRRLRQAASRVVFDFDDAVLLRPARYGVGTRWSLKRHWRFWSMMKAADAVTAGNAYLARLAQRYTSRAAVEIVPSTLNVASYGKPMQIREQAQPPVLGWIGQRSTQVYLQMIAPALRALNRKYPGLVLRCITDQPPKIEGVQIELRRWSESTEVVDLQSCDVGLAPLSDDAWARGKCGLRLLQYMGAGVPAVASPVSAQGEMVTLGGAVGATTLPEWQRAVERLLDNAPFRREQARRARELVQTRYVPSAVIDLVHAAWCGGEF